MILADEVTEGRGADERVHSTPAAHELPVRSRRARLDLHRKEPVGEVKRILAPQRQHTLSRQPRDRIPMKTLRFAPAALLLLTAACTNPADGGPPPPPQDPRITASTLTSGGEGVLQGSNLDRISGGITVDGAPVTPTARTANEIRFAMPTGRSCEVDARPVAVQAGSLSHTGQLEVPGVLTLQVGESRVLTREEMATLCLQLPAGNERYVLSALNPGLEPATVPDALFTVRSWSGSGTSAGRVSARAPLTPAAAGHVTPRRAVAAAGSHQYGETPAPFDPRYATAVVGDTLPWVDWWGSALPNCADARERIPTIRIVVAALSSSGKTVIAFDARSPHGQVWTSPAVRTRLTRAAEMMDRWAVAAVRDAMDRGYEPLKGAGGRWFHVFRTDVPGWTVDNNDAPQTACRYSSEVPSTVGPDGPPQNDAQAEYLAGLAIHEYGHHAEGVYRIRRWGSLTPPMRVSTRWGSMGEAWAQTVQETAARLASGQPTGARYTALDAPNSNVPYADFYLNGYGETPAQSLWSVTPGSRGGYYDQGTRFLMFLRERWGDATIGSGGDRFFARVQELPHYDVPSLATLVGMSATDALDRWSLAEATDDLVDPGAAAARGLPQIQSWAPQDARPLPVVMIPRTANSTRTISVGRGNYAALYLFADDIDAGKGVSLTFEGFGTAPFVMRITRLR